MPNEIKPKRSTRYEPSCGRDLGTPAERQKKYLEHIMQVNAISEGVEHTTDPKILRERFKTYLELCYQNGQKAGNMAAYAAMGICKEMMAGWAAGRKGNAEQQAFARSVQACLASYRETLASNGDINVVWAIFTAKNFDGLCDNPGYSYVEDSERPNAEVVREKYKDLLDD